MEDWLRQQHSGSISMQRLVLIPTAKRKPVQQCEVASKYVRSLLSKPEASKDLFASLSWMLLCAFGNAPDHCSICGMELSEHEHQQDSGTRSDMDASDVPKMPACKDQKHRWLLFFCFFGLAQGLELVASSSGPKLNLISWCVLLMLKVDSQIHTPQCENYKELVVFFAIPWLFIIKPTSSQTSWSPQDIAVAVAAEEVTRQMLGWQRDTNTKHVLLEETIVDHS